MKFKIPVKNKYLSFLLNEVILTVVVVALLLSIYRFWIFHNVSKVAEADNIVVLADKGVAVCDSLCVVDIIQDAESLLSAKDINIDDEARILIVKDRNSFRKRTLHLRSQALGTTIAFFKIVVMMPSDFATKMQMPTEDGFCARPIASVWAHELSHCYQYEKLGFWRFCSTMFFDKWKLEGFADYVAGTSSFNVKQGEAIFIENGEEYAKLTEDKGIWGHTYFYFVSRLRTEYLINCKGITQEDFWHTSFDETGLDDEIRNALKNGSFTLQSDI